MRAAVSAATLRVDADSRAAGRHAATDRARAPKDLKNMSIEHLDDLRAKAKYARERYRLYKAKAYGPRDTSPERLRELQRAYEQAEARLRAAEAEECRARNAGPSPPSPS